VTEQTERTGRIAAEERLRRVRIAVNEWPACTWSQDIETWKRATFGEVDADRAFDRAAQEWEELRELFEEKLWLPEDVAEECADVVITLCGLVDALGFDLADEVQKKMAKNRARKWPAPGTGGGQHIEADEEDDQAEDFAAVDLVVDDASEAAP
jgi:NTP pyrophosphatase (non-canonical NTP hydrolase)